MLVPNWTVQHRYHRAVRLHQYNMCQARTTVAGLPYTGPFATVHNHIGIRHASGASITGQPSCHRHYPSWRAAANAANVAYSTLACDVYASAWLSSLSHV